MSVTLGRLATLNESRKLENGGDPATSYISRLFAKGDDAILKKIGEEATETVLAAKDARIDGDCSKLLYETADLWFHSLVMLAHFGLTPQQVLDELARREGVSGIEEKAARKDELRDATEAVKHEG
jgi:phosphoribosyl-ATP pyrophosphohydrolase